MCTVVEAFLDRKHFGSAQGQRVRLRNITACGSRNGLGSFHLSSIIVLTL